MGILAIGTARQLFTDDRFVERAQGVTRTLNPPLKAGPLHLAVEPTGYVSLVEHEDRCYMYYRSAGGYAVAMSSDGVHWESPELNPGSENPALAFPGCEEGSVFYDPHASDGFPFKALFGFEDASRWGLDPVPAVHKYPDPDTGPEIEGALYLFRSQDGLHWECVPQVAVPFVCDSENQCLYDARLNRYVAYLRGFPEQEGSPQRFKRVAVRTEMADLYTMPWPFRRHPQRATGPRGCWGYVYDEMNIVLAADDQDPANTDLYNPCVIPYPYAQDVYLAFPSLFRTYGYGPRQGRAESYGRDLRGALAGDGLFEVQLATSRDGSQFQRWHTPYVRSGLIRDHYGVDGDLDCGLTIMGIGMLRRGDELFQYYHGARRTHIAEPKAQSRGLCGQAIFRLVQRLDGFVSLDAGPAGGEIVTPPLTFTGNRLILNADCGGLGEIWVEIQDIAGNPLPGYSLAEATSIDRNGTAQEVWWQKGPDIARLAGQAVRWHIKLRSAKLYAFQTIFAPERT
jgi:hypothetical protein